jgi:hypothetical protein
MLLARDGADGVFVQSRRQAVGFDVGGEAVRVRRVQGLLQGRVLRSAGGLRFRWARAWFLSDDLNMHSVCIILNSCKSSPV